MSAVPTAREPSARDLVQQQPIVQHFELMATATGGVARLRELILTLAVQGKLVPQDPNDEPASQLLKKICAEKDRLIAEGKIKSDKSLAEIAEEEIPFGVPASWEWVRLSELLPEFQNGASSRGDFGGEAVTVLRLADIKNRRISLADTRQIPISERDIRKYQVQVGDILITRVNGSADIVGQFTLCDSAVNAIYCDHFIRMRVCNRWIEPTFLALISESALMRGRIRELFITTAGQKTVNQGHIGSLQLGLPPLAEQSRIVTRVDELMRLCDALEGKGQLEATQHAQLVTTLLATLTDSETPEQLADNWHRVATHFDLLLDRPEAVDALEQTILQLAVRGLLVPQDPQDEPAGELLKKIRAEKDRLIAEGKIKRDKPLPPITEDSHPCDLPSGWAWMRMSDLGDFCGGKTPSTQRSSYWDGDIPWITPKDMKQLLLSNSEDKVTRAAVDDGLALIPPQSVLIVVRSGILRRTVPTALNTVETTINQDLKALVLVRPALAGYVQLVIQGFEGFILQNLTKIGTTVESMQFDAFAAQPFPLPPLAEQSRIVDRVASLRALCADLRQRLAAGQTNQSRLAEALIAMQA